MTSATLRTSVICYFILTLPTHLFIPNFWACVHYHPTVSKVINSIKVYSGKYCNFCSKYIFFLNHLSLLVLSVNQLADEQMQIKVTRSKCYSVLEIRENGGRHALLPKATLYCILIRSSCLLSRTPFKIRSISTLRL